MLLTSSWLERVEGGPEPGSVNHLARVARVVRVGLDRVFLFEERRKGDAPCRAKTMECCVTS